MRGPDHECSTTSSAEKALTWQLVDAVLGALLYSALPVESAGACAASRRRLGAGGAPDELTAAGTGAPTGIRRAHRPHRPPAAALGIGAALARTPGIASAAPSDTDSASSTRNPRTSDSTQTPSPADQSGPSAELGTTTSVASADGPPSVVRSSEGAQTSTTSPSAGQPFSTSWPRASTSSGSETSVSVAAPGSAGPAVVVRSSGGAQTNGASRPNRTGQPAARHRHRPRRRRARRAKPQPSRPCPRRRTDMAAPRRRPVRARRSAAPAPRGRPGRSGCSRRATGATHRHDPGARRPAGRRMDTGSDTGHRPPPGPQKPCRPR